MTSTNESALGPQILQVAQRDRVRTPAKRREAILDEFERSAMSAQAFAKRRGMNYSTFTNWVQRRERGRAESPRRSPAAMALVEAEDGRRDLQIERTSPSLSPVRFRVSSCFWADILIRR
jgi:transposase